MCKLFNAFEIDRSDWMTNTHVCVATRYPHTDVISQCKDWFVINQSDDISISVWSIIKSNS